ncbi:MAG TPA: acetyl-CoA C-acetyltransferase [Candidatus Bathyarchaeia archaeon]|nr:acetyl-CoA C-acetyltransferase [Candidatus Bathyarchaeia archaeon]
MSAHTHRKASQLRDVYLAYFKRTAFSKSKPEDPEKDVFNSIRMDEALSRLIKQCLTDTGVKPPDVNDLIVGCALQFDENWTMGGRHPALLAHLPEVPSVAMDRQCGSSLNAIGAGAMEIMTGNSDIVFAGGFEHLTHVPMTNNPNLKPNMALLLRPEYAKYDMNTAYRMGLTAEKLARLRGIQRDEMDQYSYESQKLAFKAQEEGYFAGEIMPLEVEKGGQTIRVDRDQSVRGDTTLEQMRKLSPAFSQDGRITAGNSCPINAGASLVMLASGEKVKEYGLTPLARILSIGWGAVDPSIMGEGVVPATKKALSNAGFRPEDIDLWEINEAFAVVVLNALKELGGIRRENVNIKGGAIAIGHPHGASGARLAGTLSRILNEKKKDRGVATLCTAGGQGYTLVLERAS